MYSKGISWIDDCRIPFVDEDTSRKQTPIKVNVYGWSNNKGQIGSFDDNWKQGRFPANLLVSDDMLNDGSIGKSNDHKWEGEDTSPIYGKYENRTRTQVYSDKGTNSRYYDIDKWFNKIIE